uniref:Amino acid transporter transmembrane domain-containing protein n=1 Tax=Tetradesmus obliquus TaxID=3088 RepID=A0A383V4H3_TETOB|eukprot:jgi/Sobl393_1/6866/SZX60505.1
MGTPSWQHHDAQGPIELTPFRSKDALSQQQQQQHADDQLQHHIMLDKEYGIQSSRKPKQWWEFLQHGGGWLLATAHIVTAIIGAGVLGLPYALSWLGWVGGIFILLLFYVITLWSSLMLAECHETNGVKHPTYRAAVLHVLGPVHAAILALFQYFNLVLSSIGYTVAAGQSLRMLVGEVCGRTRFDTCYNKVWQMSLVFGVCQLFLSQLPSLEDAWWSSIIGAAMSFMYSTCALALGASKAHHRLGSVYGRHAAPVPKAMNIFNALGSIAFAYNFTGVLMEIQSTLHEPPKARINMRRAIHTGMGGSLLFYLAVSILGYLALGDGVPGDILTGFSGPAAVVSAANVMVLLHMLPAYQVFSQPVFHGTEQALTEHVPGVRRLPAWGLRIIVRSCYVVFTTTVAAVMPFFTDIIGLVGALVFWPAAVYYPVTMYKKLYNPRKPVRDLMFAMNVAAALTSAVAVVGASYNIATHVQNYTFGWF